MSDALEFFKRIYGAVPEWVVKMHTFSPEALNAYMDLRLSVLKDGALTRKEKELILVGINAARRYERSMIYHTQGAVDAGATLEELAEIFSACVLSRGLPAWLEGVKSLNFAAQYKNGSKTDKETGIENSGEKELVGNLKTSLEYYQNNFHTIPNWVSQLAHFNPDALIHYTSLRNTALNNGKVSRKLKELVLVGINTSERYAEGVRIHTEGARSCGATEGELAECHLTALLTAGIPAWFEGSDFLSSLT